MKERTFEGERKANKCTLHAAGSAGVTKQHQEEAHFIKRFLFVKGQFFIFVLSIFLLPITAISYRRKFFEFSAEPPALGHF